MRGCSNYLKDKEKFSNICGACFSTIFLFYVFNDGFSHRKKCCYGGDCVIPIQESDPPRLIFKGAVVNVCTID